MSLLIQQQQQEDERPSCYYHRNTLMKKMLNSLGVLQSNCHINNNKNNNNSFSVYRLFDLDGKFKFKININQLEDKFVFTSTLIKNSQPYIVTDTANKYVYWRLLSKYQSINSFIVALTKQGQFITRTVVFCQRVDYSHRLDLEQFRQQRGYLYKQMGISRELQATKQMFLQFVRESVVFYKRLCPKLQGSVMEISRRRPQYAFKQQMATSICNNSFLPTLQEYKMLQSKQHNSQDSSMKLYYRKQMQDVGGLAVMNKQMGKLNSELYGNGDMILSINSSIKRQQRNQQQNTRFNLQQIYTQLLQSPQPTHHNHHYEKSHELFLQQQNDLSIYHRIFVTNLQISYSRKENRDSQIVNYIKVISPQLINWEHFDSTALSEIKIGKVKYCYCPTISVNSKSLGTKSADKGVNYLKEKQQHPTMLVAKQKQQLVLSSATKINTKTNHHRLNPQTQQVAQSMMILKHQIPTKANNSNPQQSRNKYFGQLKWEKAIIESCFNNQFCIYISRFFVPFNFNDHNKILHLSTADKEPVYVLSEYLKKGPLNKWLGENGTQSSIFTKINLILCILYGVRFLHQKKILHMDLKPQNILMDRNLVPKLIDFGSAYNKQVYQKMRRQKQNYYLSFSIPYTAPQIFMKSHKPQITTKCDVFSLGLIIYQILFNRQMFGESSDKLERLFKEIGLGMDQWLGRRHCQTRDRIIKTNVAQQGDKQQFEEMLLKRVFLCPQTVMQHRSPLFTLFLNIITRCLSCNQQKRPNLGMLIIAIKQIYQMFVEFYAW